MSMLTTAGPTRLAALTTVREYSSSSAASSRPGDAFDDSSSGPASDSFNKAATVGSWLPATLGILITKTSGSSYGWSTTCRSYPYIPGGMLLSPCALERLALHRGHAQVVPGLRDGRPMPIPSRARPHCRQMDDADHPVAVEKDDALRRAPARDRRHFAKDAYPNASQSRARRFGRPQSLSGRSAEG